MKPHILCVETQRGTDTFYLVTPNGRYFLFDQAHRRGVYARFCKGLLLDEVYDFSKSKGDWSVMKTQSKLPVYIKYIETEYGIAVLSQTIRRTQLPALAG